MWAKRVHGSVSDLLSELKWTQAIAAGERASAEAIEDQIISRRQTVVTGEGGSWVLREEHGADFEAKKRAMSPPAGRPR